MAEPIMRFAEHLQMLRSESDRAALIIAAAMLDELLGELLRSRLVPSASRDDSLFDGPNAPFSAFSARIDACHRLGLISLTFARDLHIVRRLRNDFAHHAPVVAASIATFRLDRTHWRLIRQELPALGTTLALTVLAEVHEFLPHVFP